jgi:hypothetical protein
MRFQRLLVRQELIQRLIEPLGVDLLGPGAEEFLQGGPPIPGVGDVQFAGRLAEAGDGEDRGHRAPGHVLASPLDPLLEKFLQPQHPPQPPGQPDVAEVACPFQADAAELDQERLVLLWYVAPWRIEERALQAPWPSFSVEMRTELGLAVLFFRGQFAQIGDYPLPRSSGRAIGLDQCPVRVRLAVLAPSVASKKHERSFTRRKSSPNSIARLCGKSTK